MLNSDELHELYEGLKLNNVNHYDYVLTGKCCFSLESPGYLPKSKSDNPCLCLFPNWLITFSLLKFLLQFQLDTVLSAVCAVLHETGAVIQPKGGCISMGWETWPLNLCLGEH